MQERALVLGGGGVTGVAWEIGLLAGLAAAGLDLRLADLVVGTSAGSVVGVDLTSGQDLDDLYHSQLEPPAGERVARMGMGILARLAWITLTSRGPDQARRRIGRYALAARTEPEASRRTAFERLPVREWPSDRLRVTALDAATGELVVFDSAGDAAVIDAVGASCAVPGVWPPVTIGGRRYIDGGMRSAANADLAAGFDRVLIIAPIAQGAGYLTSAGRQAAELARQGARVALIKPDEPARVAIGRNVLDPARRAPAARAGREQAARVAAEVAAVWQDDPAA